MKKWIHEKADGILLHIFWNWYLESCAGYSDKKVWLINILTIPLKWVHYLTEEAEEKD